MLTILKDINRTSNNDILILLLLHIYKENTGKKEKINSLRATPNGKNVENCIK